ncbi:MAG TPA: carbohydrate binding domain-containing protein, partial [Polyangiaceae bacterium]|nr:carbohydrate binding domain-containing protein [Polyangiaceae bacterium]
MRLSAISRLPLTILLLSWGASALLGACGSGPDDAGLDDECTSNAECGASAECSGGKCVAITTCSSTTGCAAGQECTDGVCRTPCTDDSACAGSGLICDTSAGVCMPASNPTGTGGGSGTGGTGTGTGGTGTGGTTGGEPTTSLIDDLEDGDVRIADVGSRVGYWYTYNENAARPRVTTAALVQDGGSTVLHATGSHQGGVAADAAYGGLGVDLNNPDPSQQGPLSASREPYDASDWDGFTFRIKSSSTKSIRFEIVTTQIATQAEGGNCTSGTCFDAFGMDVLLSAEWTTVKVPFTEVVQEGWGDTKSFDPSSILGVAFEDLSTGSWDFHVDDLAFYLEAETETPSEPGDPGNPEGGDPTCSGSWGEEPNGSITWYTFDQGTAAIGDVNCSYGIAQNPDRVNHIATQGGTYFGAINTTDYATAAACGACVEVSRPAQNKKVVVTVVDQCPVATNPKCVKGHIDLSKAAFLQLGTESEGYI